MPNGNSNGKAGTLTVEDFNKLKSLATSHGEKTLALKVAKVCSKFAAPLTHEYPNSAVGKAYVSTAKKITDSLGTASPAIPGSAFTDVSKMVSKYGAELIVMKLSKIAKKNNNAAMSTQLKSIFPSS